MAKKYEVLALGAPFIDRLVRVDDAFIFDSGLEKGSCPKESVDLATLNALLEKSGTHEIQIAGGCAANTMRGLASLGHTGGLIGCIGNDSMGDLFLESISGLPIVNLLETADLPTAQALCLITKDGERTLVPFTGAEDAMSPHLLHHDIFSPAILLYMEGYQFRNETLPEKALGLSKEHGVSTAMNLPSVELVRDLKEEMLSVLNRGLVDILFCNEDEARELTGKSPESAMEELSAKTEISVITLGPDGCVACKDSEILFVETEEVKVLDTTGAGDLFAAGFIHGVLEGMDLRQSAQWANAMGASVIQVMGSSIPHHLLPDFAVE